MRYVLTQENVKILAKSIHLYMNNIKGVVMFTSSVDYEIEKLIEDMITDEKAGEENLKALGKMAASKLKFDNEAKEREEETKRLWKIEKLKRKAMLR